MSHIGEEDDGSSSLSHIGEEDEGICHNSIKRRRYCSHIGEDDKGNCHTSVKKAKVLVTHRCRR